MGELNSNVVQYPIPKAISNIIQSISIPYTINAEDKLIWNFTSNGIFSAKTVYCLIDSNLEHNNGQDDRFGRIWRLKVPNKIKMFSQPQLLFM